jgi:hypothetical protein
MAKRTWSAPQQLRHTHRRLGAPLCGLGLAAVSAAEPTMSSVRDWFPDQFSYVDHEVRALPFGIARRAHLSDTSAHNIIDAAVVAVAELKDGADNLSPLRWAKTKLTAPTK